MTASVEPIDNTPYLKALRDFSKLVDPDKYFVVGSIGTLSHTISNGYYRQVHDVDIIMDYQSAQKINNLMDKFGYQKHTFINKRMPFYAKLIKHAEYKYIRLEKDGVALEILVTPFIYSNSQIMFEMYPKVWALFPRDCLQTNTLESVPFTTLSKEMLLYMKRLSNNTLGRILKYKKAQRIADIAALEKIVRKEDLLKINKSCGINVGIFKFTIPNFLIDHS